MEDNQTTGVPESHPKTHVQISDVATPTVVAPADVAPKAKKALKPPKDSGKLVALVLAALVVVVAGLGVWFMTSNRAATANQDTSINTAEYQAVFLTNGQVYFGKLTDLGNAYVTISDIYYLQVQQSLQQGSAGNTSSQVSLAKLGSELHGPEDKMHIASDQVLFWENMKNDSKVTQAITAYKNK